MKAHSILMLGWELPPFNSGGLGVACQGLAKGLALQGEKVVFVLPKKIDCKNNFFKILFASSAEIKTIEELFSAYSTFYLQKRNFIEYGKEKNEKKCSSLIEEVFSYAENIKKFIGFGNFDLIHAHDWLSFPAAIEAKSILKKPLIAHIHATEFDRTGGNNVNQKVYEIEREGLIKADAVVAVSNFTKQKIINHYGINPEKIHVLHNAIDPCPFLKEKNKNCSLGPNKIVLFLGRLTLQKGPDYFLYAAKRVLEKMEDVYFVIAGSGDMERQIINLACELGIAEKIIFAGFLRGERLEEVYRGADLYVLPSVSEPFGITPLEAINNGTPALISKQSGISELLNNCLKVDFWNIEQMANKILAILKYRELKECLQENGTREISALSWENTAKQCLNIYEQVLQL